MRPSVASAVGKILLLSACGALPMSAMCAVSALYNVQIDAGRADAGLRQLAEQTGVQILFQPDVLNDVQTAGVAGRMTGMQALSRLLPSSAGVIVSEINSSTVSISRRPPAFQGTDTETVADSSGGPQDEAGHRPNDNGAISQILVQGARTLNVDILRNEDDVQPYIVLDKEVIARSGATDLQAFLKQNLTAASPTSQASQISGPTGNVTSFDLRGLGSEETLVLVNGRRIASLGVNGKAQQPDLGGIPLSAIERIEVLPTTAAGIFGGSATGGVINVVLKQKYDGLDVSTYFENTFHATAPARRVALSGGFSPDGGTTSIFLSGSYLDQDRLYVSDRDFLAESRSLTIRNNPSTIYAATNPPLGATSNIRSTTAVLKLKPQYGGATLPANFTYVPYGYGGVATDNGAALVAHAGQYNLDPAQTSQLGGGGKQTLLTGPTVSSLSASVRRKLTADIEAFSELAYSKNEGVFTNNPTNATYTLASTAASNPFTTNVRVTTPITGLDGNDTTVVTTRRAILGALTKLPADWTLSAEYSWSRSTFETSLRTQISTAPGAADVRSGAINLFRDTNVFPVDFSGFAVPNSMYGPINSTVNNPSIRVGGSLPFELPGGRPTLTAMTEVRREDLGDGYSISPTAGSSFYYPSQRQTIRSVYVETRLPLVSSINAMPGLKSLEFQLAGRNDHYSILAANIAALDANGVPAPTVRDKNKLSSTDPTLGLRYQPVSSVTFRGSYGTGFLPPALTQLVPDAPLPQIALPEFDIHDPRRGNELVLGEVTVYSGGNPNLRPETARSWSVGMILEPEFLERFRFSIDRTKIRKSNNIGLFDDIQALLNNEQYVDGIIRRAPATPQNDPQGYGVGPIIGFDQSFQNFARTDIETVDLALDYTLRTENAGSFSVSLKGTRFVHFEEQTVPTSPLQEQVGLRSNLNWIANGALTWNWGSWQAGWQTQYYDKYWLNQTHSVVVNQGSATIPSQIYHDAFVGFRPRVTGYFLENTSFQIGAKNVFDKTPPIVAANTLGYSSIGDPRLARYYLNVTKSF